MVSHHKLASHFATFGYHGQAAFYLDLWNAATGEKRDRFAFLVQQSEAPFEIALVELGQLDIDAGRRWYQQAIAKYAICLQSDEWPSPWAGKTILELPSYAAGM